MGDAAGSIAVIVGVGVIHTTGLTIVDPIVVVLIAILVIWSAIRILGEGVKIILQRSPIPTSEIKKDVESIEGGRKCLQHKKLESMLSIKGMYASC